MSYTNVNGMRSTRYPMSGLGGCACSAALPTLGATPQELATYIGVGTVVVGLGSLALFAVMSKKVRRNPRRRRGRRSRRLR